MLFFNKNMRISVLTVSFCFMLSACTKVQDSTNTALNDVEKETASTWTKARNILDLNKPVVAKKAPSVPPRYCYRSMQDVICYNKPLVGQEERLLAYQDKNSVGYVIDPPKEPVAKKEVEKPVGESKKAVPDVTAEKAPAPAATPAATEKPKDSSNNGLPKKDDIKNLKEIIFDPAELEPKKLVPDAKMQ